MIKLFVTDCDGCLTDGTVEYCSDGKISRRFSVIDGKGLYFLKKLGIKLVLLTSSNSKDIENRAKDLNFDYCCMGVENKLETLIDICKENSILLSEVAGMGDDLQDMEFLRQIKIIACPQDAQYEIKHLPKMITVEKDGGKGAVRSFINYLLFKTKEITK